MFIYIFLFSQVVESKWVSLAPVPTVNFGIEFGYDDNIFKYSPEDIANFRNNIHPNRFKNVESYDDFVTSEKLRVNFIPPRRERTKFQFRYNRHQYAVNPIKNYQSLTLKINQDLLNKVYLEMEYLLLPQFYIRDYFDDDFNNYKRCDFREQLITVKMGSRDIARNVPTDIALIYKFGLYDYNSYFDEYDTRANILGAEVSQTLLKNIDIVVKYLYNNAIAQAYDDAGETPLNSDESDISYREHQIETELSYKLNKQLSIKAIYEYGKRIYTSAKPIEVDPSHRDREDFLNSISGKIDLNVTGNMGLNLSYTYKTRAIDSPRKAEITEVKNYNKNVIKAGLVFKIK